jgi:hypothetical protein
VLWTLRFKSVGETFMAAIIRIGIGMLLLIGSMTAWSQDPVPGQLTPPAGEKLVLQAHGKGDQVYTCKKTGDQYAWTLKEPQAELLDDQNKVIGHHYIGPTGVLNDGSQVVGKIVAKVDSPDSIPWLLLTAGGHAGKGTFSSVTSIQRLRTTGGKAPASGCDAGHENNESRTSYTADYLFYSKP